MHIAIIGVGKVGGSLARSLAAAGHTVRLGVRDPDKVAELTSHPGISAHSLPESVRGADVLIMTAVPSAVPDIVAQLGDLSTRVIIDAMNSVGAHPPPYAHSTEALRALTGSPHVVKCFNTTGFENMANPRYGDQQLDMFMAGDSATGKALARQLALDIGFGECYDCGGHDRVALLESLAMVWINLAIFQKVGRHIGFKLLTRNPHES